MKKNFLTGAFFQALTSRKLLKSVAIFEPDLNE